MDVRCSTCGEPWDVYHLQHDAIFDTTLTLGEAKAWIKLPGKAKLAKRYRDEFSTLGWQFGESMVNVIHCPCCPKGAEPDPDTNELKRMLEETLGDDEDALAAELEDLGI